MLRCTTVSRHLVNHQSPTFPSEADIVIIGSGITGTSIAYTLLAELQSLGQTQRIVILEAREACSGATGRNCEHVKVPVYEVYSRNKRRYRAEKARKIVEFQKMSLSMYREVCKKFEVKAEDSQLREVESVELFLDKSMFDAPREMVDELKEEWPEMAAEIEVEVGETCRQVSLHAFDLC